MSILKVDTLQPATGSRVLSAGHVVQVVAGDHSTFSTRFTTTSTSFVTTGYSLTITPTSASSKILITSSMSMHISANGHYAGAKIYRGASALGSEYYIGVVGGQQWGFGTNTYLDSPSTTSATTYTIYARVTNSSGTGYFGWDGSFSSPSVNGCAFILQEIAQ